MYAKGSRFYQVGEQSWWKCCVYYQENRNVDLITEGLLISNKQLRWWVALWITISQVHKENRQICVLQCIHSSLLFIPISNPSTFIILIMIFKQLLYLLWSHWVYRYAVLPPFHSFFPFHALCRSRPPLSPIMISYKKKKKLLCKICARGAKVWCTATSKKWNASKDHLCRTPQSETDLFVPRSRSIMWTPVGYSVCLYMWKQRDSMPCWGLLSSRGRLSTLYADSMIHSWSYPR